MATFTAANLEPRGEYRPTGLDRMIYGRGSIEQLPSILNDLKVCKAFIVTGNSLYTKTPVIKHIEALLGDKHIKTFSKISQHAPVKAIREAAQEAKEEGVDVFISVGGGSPIDSVKAIIHSLQKDLGGEFLPHIAVPTTLSVAETTAGAGYTNDSGHKVGVFHRLLYPRVIIYDGDLALHTPTRLFLSSGMRAVDHALETLYNPSSSEVPHRLLCLSVARELFGLLKESKKDPKNADIRQRLQVVAFGSLFSFSGRGGLGLSHSMGHALGATYHIPHGITSCLTLAPVLKYKSITSPPEATQIARLAPFLGIRDQGSDQENGIAVSEKVAELIEDLGLKSTLTEYNVPNEQSEWEAIADRALHGKREGKLFGDVVEITKGLY